MWVEIGRAIYQANPKWLPHFFFTFIKYFLPNSLDMNPFRPMHAHSGHIVLASAGVDTLKHDLISYFALLSEHKKCNLD